MKKFINYSIVILCSWCISLSGQSDVVTLDLEEGVKVGFRDSTYLRTYRANIKDSVRDVTYESRGMEMLFVENGHIVANFQHPGLMELVSVYYSNSNGDSKVLGVIGRSDNGQFGARIYSRKSCNGCPDQWVEECNTGLMQIGIDSYEVGNSKIDIEWYSKDRATVRIYNSVGALVSTEDLVYSQNEFHLEAAVNSSEDRAVEGRLIYSIQELNSKNN